MCRKKAQTEQNNSYGVEKETGKDALYKKTAVLMAAATILAAISSIGGHHLYCYTRAKERYEDVHSFTTEDLDYIQMIAKFSLKGRDLSDAKECIAELRNALSNDSIKNYYQKNPFRYYFYHAYSNGDWENGVLYRVCAAIENKNGFEYY